MMGIHMSLNVLDVTDGILPPYKALSKYCRIASNLPTTAKNSRTGSWIAEDNKQHYLQVGGTETI